MTADEYRALVAAHGYSVVGFGRFMGWDERTSRRYASEKYKPGEPNRIPKSAAMLLRGEALPKAAIK